LLAVPGTTQNLQRIDSLSKKSTGSVGQEQFEVLNDLAWEYRLVNPDSTIQIGKRAHELGKKLDLSTGLSRPLNFIGVGYEYRAMSVDAYSYYMQALTTASNQNDALQIAYANNNLGRLFLDQGNILKALEAYQTALSIFETREDLSGLASVHLSLAQYYNSQKEFKKAEEFYLKVIETRNKVEKTPNISSFNQIGIFYRESGNIKKANYYLLKADSLCEVRNNEVNRVNINFQLAMTRLLEEKYDEAEAFARKAIDYSLRKGINAKRVYNVLAKIKFQQGNYAKAKENFNIVLSGAKTFRDSDIRMDAYYHLAKIYEKEGSYDNQLINENLYLTLKDSLSGIELNKQLEKLKFQFNLELEQKKTENDLLRTLDSKNNMIIKKQQTINTIYLVALGVIIVVSVMLFRNSSIKNKLNIELEKIQDKILIK
jgi:tetratricopeptide (TPR) repeat protein